MDLSSFTHIVYDPETTGLLEMDDEQPLVVPFVAEATPEYKFYQLEIQRKVAELQALSLQRLPQIGLYSYYLFYGYNPDNPARAISNFGQRSISGGMSVVLPIFDGFKNSADRQKKKLEIAHLQVERDQKLWDLRQQHEKLNADASMYKIQMSTKAKILSGGEEKATMEKRLSDQQVTDKAKCLADQIELIEQQFRLDKASIRRIATLKKLKTLVEG